MYQITLVQSSQYELFIAIYEISLTLWSFYMLYAARLGTIIQHSTTQILLGQLYYIATPSYYRDNYTTQDHLVIIGTIILHNTTQILQGQLYNIAPPRIYRDNYTTLHQPDIIGSIIQHSTSQLLQGQLYNIAPPRYYRGNYTT